MQGNEQFIIEFSVKPFISFVWLGFILMIVGFFFPIRKPLNPNDNVEKEDEK
jgi:cytochrome c biogenesis factor